MKNKFDTILTTKNELAEIFGALDYISAHKEELGLTDETINNISDAVFTMAISNWISCLRNNL